MEAGEGAPRRPETDGRAGGMTGVTRAASPGPTLHPEDVVPRGGPCGVTGRAFVETAVTDLGLCQMQGARREQAIPGGARGPGETPTYPHPTGKTLRPNSNQPPPPGSLPGLKQCSPPTLRPSPLPGTSRPRPAPPPALMHSLAIPPPCLELRGGVRVHVEAPPTVTGEELPAQRPSASKDQGRPGSVPPPGPLFSP